MSSSGTSDNIDIYFSQQSNRNNHQFSSFKYHISRPRKVNLQLMLAGSQLSYVILINIFCNGFPLPLFRMGFFGANHGCGGKRPPPLKPVTHILQWWNLAQLYLTQRRSKKCMNHMTHSLGSADISIFLPEISKFCYIKKYRYRLYFDT